jgi:hypothetical protein
LLENISAFWVFPVSRKEDSILKSHAQMTDEAIDVVHELRSKAGEYSKVVYRAKKRSGPEGSRLRVRLSGADRWMFSSDAHDKERRAKAVEQAGGDVLEAVRVLSK